MLQSNKNSEGNARRVLFALLALLAFTGFVLFGCSNKDPEEFFGGDDSSSSFDVGCEDCGEPQSSSSEFGPIEGDDSSSSDDSNEYSSSSDILDVSNSSSSGAVWFSSSSSAVPSSSSVDTGANCAYSTTWCGGIAYQNVKKTSISDEVGATEKGQDRPTCVYATAITQIGNESGGISINGNVFATGSASRCGGDSGHGWGDPAACATKFSGVAKADGGYYIYVPAWAGQDFKTIGGTPVCNGTGPITSGSSSSRGGTQSSSSAGGGSTGSCVDPMYGVPQGGVTSCVKKGDKCYTCNPDRGSDCLQPWVWQVSTVDEYWYMEVDCNEKTTPAASLTCTGLAGTGLAGTAITQPTVRCNGQNTSANSIAWTNAPNWTNPTANTYDVGARATSGTCNGITADCGRIVVSAAQTSTLTCAGMPQTGTAGTAITAPTVRCGTQTVTPTWGSSTPNAPSWNSPVAGTYIVKATADCSNSSQTADCGTLTVTAAASLTCASVAESVVAGTPVTPPAVTCNGSTVASNTIYWENAPNMWSAPTTGTYNNIKATPTTGACNGTTANCPGILQVNPKLTCASVTQAITTGNRATAPTVTCGSTAVASNNITWSTTSPNNANFTGFTSNITAAGTITGVKAKANSGNCNGQTADCAGTITVTASIQTPSSSSGGGGGGSPTYTPTTPGTERTKTTQYWDACKPSCSWSGKGGLQANACNITGSSIGHSDSDRSACDGGSAFACMKQAPWKVGNVSFGYVAASIGACGDCYQLDFPNNAVMVVMKTNIGDIKEGGIFDLMIPGGGVGDFDALTRQVTNSGVSSPDMGVRYGGFRGKCGWQGPTVPECVRGMCNSAFANLPDLKAGCLWYANTLGTDDASFNNPEVRYKKVNCPKELTDRY